ncbi:hypothetical protein Lser_V15G22541 [Lactuca serriola]
MEPNEDCSSDMSGKDPLPSETYAYGLYGPIGTHSRIGDEYQTQIPPLITNPEYLDYIKNPIEEEMKAGVSSEFLIGLDIPIFWIKKEREMKIEAQIDIKQEDSNSTSDLGSISNDLCLVPGCFLETWTETEKGSFVLGLYIFEKDFVRLKRFIESKNMGDILAYYYGTFYRSDEYRRWSESRKSRGKRCIMGARIFSTLRQQELLSRLMPNVSQECQNSLLEICRSFGDGRISLEQYVFSLRSLIGMKAFVDAMAIGKGKQDLTGSNIEPTKQNQAIHIRPEIPVGKACSSLSSTEIIQFLTGDYRLSKARSNDLFWEAVWPRLLANGWHSEQPNGYNYTANGKHNLVFLMPGIKKFSRRLIKGETYMDSVTDVLNRVASHPQILEIDDENGDIEMKLQEEEEDEEDAFLEKRKTHCYLQPRAPSLGTLLFKFTVVDTSLSGKIVRVREIEPRDLDSGEVSELVSDESDSANTNTNTFLAEQETGCKPNKKLKTGDENERKSPEVKRKVVSKAKLARKAKPENNSGHHKRRRRLTACAKAGSSRDTDDLMENVGSSSQANNHNLSSNLSFSSKCSSIDTVDEHKMNLIDLNVTPEFVNSEFVPERHEKQSESLVVPKVEENGGGGSRRQSTRNRPPTARALEALANGFLTVNCRKKGKEDGMRDSSSGSRSRGFRHSRGEIGVASECSTGDASSVVKGEDENGPFNGEIAK